MTATCAESATNAESRTTTASGCLPTPERKEKMEDVLSNSAPANLAYHDPKRAPTLARIERLVGHPVDPVKLRAKLDAARATVEVAPVQTLGAEPLTREEKGSGLTDGPCPPSASPRSNLEGSSYYLVGVGAGPASYAHRAELKALHLRWDPVAREWTGVVLGSDIPSLESLGLVVMVRSGVAPLPSLPRGPSVPGRRQPRDPQGSAPRRPRDHAKTSVEAYLPKGERESLGRLSRFTLLDITSGLADDTREDDQRVRAQVEAERKGRVAAALAALEAHPVARAQVFHDQTRLRLFCARFSVTPVDICPRREDVFPAGARCGWCRGTHGAFRPIHVEDLQEVLSSPADWMSEVRAREVAVLPGSDYDDG
ncbi:MAG: hypothetical protein KGJ23_11415 [Euryarchaeota archaeon]|nr:hypothetical protein [Euryarchaeota archaeon]MDE1837203.1 hypothetical protein [Euryarchaeota archaeon]MDE1881431.1 hypothetical protein [Euryarchaeota archaeon]MDE2045359.1 hypothetical protein [Thermoplasmata archaeon]